MRSGIVVPATETRTGWRPWSEWDAAWARARWNAGNADDLCRTAPFALHPPGVWGRKPGTFGPETGPACGRLPGPRPTGPAGHPIEGRHRRVSGMGHHPPGLGGRTQAVTILRRRGNYTSIFLDAVNGPNLGGPEEPKNGPSCRRVLGSDSPTGLGKTWDEPGNSDPVKITLSPSGSRHSPQPAVPGTGLRLRGQPEGHPTSAGRLLVRRGPSR